MAMSPALTLKRKASRSGFETLHPLRNTKIWFLLVRRGKLGSRSQAKNGCIRRAEASSSGRKASQNGGKASQTGGKLRELDPKLQKRETGFKNRILEIEWLARVPRPESQ
jgi:hypothetical protein